MLILTFLAIVSGAALALAWHMIAPPLLARIARSRLTHTLRSRTALGLLLVLPFAAIAAAVAMNAGRLKGELAAPAAQNPQLAEAAAEAPHDLQGAVAELEAKLAKNPNDVEGWRLLSRSYAELNEPDKAADAARHAAALGTGGGGGANDAEALSEHGEDLVTAAGGSVTPEARQAFEAALASDPSDPRARFFIGLAEAQDGKNDAALDRWLALEKDSPPGAPWLQGLKVNIDRLAQEMGVSSAQVAQRLQAAKSVAPIAPVAPVADETQAAAPSDAATPSPDVPGPTAADVAAAQNMSPDQRTAMIRAMVQRLADQMKANPKDADGWLRLARAYDVLGEHDKALDAYRNATAADPSRADARQAYAAARAQGGASK